ncbi:MAG: MFS transporter, partial [Planctomycetes bacterium]|nr:MFS transporter [Planctomycetota bacterium]
MMSSKKNGGDFGDKPMADLTEPRRWYQGITRYQWLVLIIASLGWIFDVFEGQIFVASMRNAMPALLDVAKDSPQVSRWNDWAFASFLLGGALGGVLFGVISDKFGRSRTMIITILFYSLFTCVTAFAQEPYQMVVLRFFVAMGVGGEWAVASAMVAEVMPERSRPMMSSIFHASSVFGTLLAAAAGAYVVGNPALGANAWRWGFAIGVVPALLTLWVRWKLREPDRWVKARERAVEDKQAAAGRIVELFQGAHLRNTIVGVSIASIGLVTFWGAHIYGKNALLRHAQNEALA